MRIIPTAISAAVMLVTVTHVSAAPTPLRSYSDGFKRRLNSYQTGPLNESLQKRVKPELTNGPSVKDIIEKFGGRGAMKKPLALVSEEKQAIEADFSKLTDSPDLPNPISDAHLADFMPQADHPDYGSQIPVGKQEVTPLEAHNQQPETQTPSDTFQKTSNAVSTSTESRLKELSSPPLSTDKQDKISQSESTSSALAWGPEQGGRGMAVYTDPITGELRSVKETVDQTKGSTHKEASNVYEGQRFAWLWHQWTPMTEKLKKLDKLTDKQKNDLVAEAKKLHEAIRGQTEGELPSKPFESYVDRSRKTETKSETETDTKSDVSLRTKAANIKGRIMKKIKSIIKPKGSGATTGQR